MIKNAQPDIRAPVEHAVGHLAVTARLSQPTPITASILRTHSQCQRGSSRPNITALARGEPFLFIPRNIRVGGGAYRDRTDDLMLAKQPLSQLS